MIHSAKKCAALLLGLLTACQATPQPKPQPTPIAPQPAVRAAPHPSHRLSDRGIGGTGAPQTAPSSTADRGIGGTGILGIITGFGSILVDGIEIQYDKNAAVDIDGTAATAPDLRVGQLVAVQAEGPDTALHATRISIQTAVAGRIDPPRPGAAVLTIGGQPVFVPPETAGAETVSAGEWVRVSGLRRDDGVIVATRLDPAPAGTLLVRGQLARDAGGARIGNLVLPESVTANVNSGQFVIVSGDQTSTEPHVTEVAADPLLADPAAWFGPADDTLILQAFLHLQNGEIVINGLTVTPDPALARQDLHDGIAIISLHRQPDGTYKADSARYTDDSGQHSNGAGQGDRLPDQISDRTPTTVRRLAKASLPPDLRSEPSPPAPTQPASATATLIVPAAPPPVEPPQTPPAATPAPVNPPPPAEASVPASQGEPPEIPANAHTMDPLISGIGIPSPTLHAPRSAKVTRHSPASAANKGTTSPPSPVVVTGAVTASDNAIAPLEPPATPAPIVSAPAPRHATPKAGASVTPLQ